MEDFQLVNEYRNIGETLDAIPEEHKELSKNHWSLQYVAHTVAELVNTRLSTELNRIRLGTNNTDRNSQILIELVQGMMQNNNMEHIATTADYKSVFMSEAEALVQNRIAKLKQRKDSKMK